MTLTADRLTATDSFVTFSVNEFVILMRKYSIGKKQIIIKMYLLVNQPLLSKKTTYAPEYYNTFYFAKI